MPHEPITAGFGMPAPLGREDQPLVTIVTPSLNQGRFIEQTIQSVLHQDYPRVEYIIMDGGSTDETANVVQEYADRLTFISEKDRGQTDAINKGFRRSHGEILAWLNSDDTYLPGAISSAVEVLSANPKAAFVYGEGYHVREDGAILDRYPTEPFSAQRLKETCFICQPTVFMRRQAVRRIGYLDERLHFCMDYDLWYRLSQQYPAVYIDKFLATSRLHATTKTLGQRVQAHWETTGMWKRHSGEVPSPWVYALSHAIVETRLKLDRSVPKQNALFVLVLTCVSAALFLYFNQHIKPADAKLMGEWLRGFQRELQTRIWSWIGS